MEKDIFQVLWFDDKPQDGFKLNAYLSGIIITEAKNLIDGLNLLKSPHLWDALIFDANYKKNKDDEASLVLTDLIYEVEKVTKNKTPWFVLTAGDYKGIDAVSLIIHETTWERELGTKRYYSKLDEDEDVLFEDIKRTVKYRNSVEWRTKNKYGIVLEIFDNRSLFNALGDIEKAIIMKLLIALESPQEASNPDHLNNIRKFIAGGVMKTLKNMGVIPVTIKELNVKGKHLGDFRFRESIPIHVQRAFHTIISTCQDGSHSCSEGDDGEIPPQIDRLVREGKAPYLLKSLVLELLNILIWLKSFIVSNNERDKNLIDFRIKETETLFSREGEVSLREGDNYAFLIVSEKERYYIKPAILNEYSLTNKKIIEAEIGEEINTKIGKQSKMVIKIKN